MKAVMDECEVTIMVPVGGPPRPTAVLRHELPDGTHHFDWLLARDEAGTRPLITFRVPRPPSEMAPGDNLSAQRIADHRTRYLNYQGEVSGGRGHVQRHASGDIVSWFTIPGSASGSGSGSGSDSASGESWELEIEWTPPAGGRLVQRLRLAKEKLAEWRLFCVTISQMAE